MSLYDYNISDKLNLVVDSIGILKYKVLISNSSETIYQNKIKKIKRKTVVKTSKKKTKPKKKVKEHGISNIQKLFETRGVLNL